MSPLTSEVGSAFRRYGSAGHLLTGFAIILVAVDLSNLIDYQSWWRCMPTLLSMVVFGVATRLDWRSMGLIFTPAQGWSYWCRLTVKLGFSMLLLLVIYFVVFAGLNHFPSVLPMNDGRFVFSWILRSCVFYPIVEEGAYRFTLCTPTVASLGCWPTVALSGLMFGLLHLCYGNVAPENLVGGFILAWSYLKSESIFVPLVLHSLGNLCIILLHFAYFYYWAI